ncbi:hypothetical protein MSSAC_1020 [Methanosarcina siciliae C2J]|uniref:Uncharacterized protein n=1 Tax=Methanosarcina siciliae C2J TaxID=1434118 RepID=A0A0E3PLE1_9EURY|nr:hypothetical protein [Methanosarcina siciliae]AKB35610.1 hypothetical protein MSSAC_1020 [Methanosarcina siciliae C2J]
MAEGDSRNLKYPFGVDGTEIAASDDTTKPDSGFINVDGAEYFWLTGSYTGDSTSVTINVLGYADENDNGDVIRTMTLGTGETSGKMIIEGGLPFVKIEGINDDDTNPATLKVILNIVR